MKVVCIGHSVYDITLPVDKFPEENKKLRVPERIECGGGPASNGAYLLAKWGMDTSIVSVIGNDYYGSKIKEDYINIGINIDNLEIRDNRSTSSSYIIANKETGTRTIITYKEPQIRKLNKEVNIEADVILVDGEHPETAYEVLEKNPNAISVLDAGRVNDDTKFLGKFVTYFVCSKEYAEDFTEKDIDINDIEGLISIHKSLEEYFKTNITAGQPGKNGGSDMLNFEELYEKYATDVLRVSYFYLGDRQKAEDVCQDVFVRLMTNAPQLEEGREKAWLLKVALNRCRDLWRGAWVKRVVLGSPVFETIPAPDEASRRDDEEAMMAAIHRLPAAFRESILLYYYQGYGIGEIAEMLDLPEGTISSRLSRARKKLEEILKEEGVAQ